MKRSKILLLIALAILSVGAIAQVTLPPAESYQPYYCGAVVVMIGLTLWARRLDDRGK